MKQTLLLIGIPFIVFTVVSFVLSEKACTYILQAKPQKEIPFNHITHIDKYGASCDDCHGYYDNGRFKGLPSVAECTVCHDRQGPSRGTDESIVPLKKPMFEKIKDTDRPWGAYAQQTDLVYFSHKVVMTAKFEDGRTKMICTNCHGNKAKSVGTEMLRGKLLMGQCEDCHTALSISNQCAVCHD